MTVRLIVFDKDGTLIAWNVWDGVIGAVLDEFVPTARRERAAAALGYDVARREVRPGSPVIGGSNGEVIDLLYPYATDTDRPAFHAAVEARFADLAIDDVAERPGATDLLRVAADAGVATALCTNDSTAAARAQVARLGWADLIPLVYGYDAGHGAKPTPGMLLAALSATACAAADAVMVGDSGADMVAAERAGVRSVYVGTDPAWQDAADLAVAGLPEVSAALFDRP